MYCHGSAFHKTSPRWDHRTDYRSTTALGVSLAALEGVGICRSLLLQKTSKILGFSCAFSTSGPSSAFSMKIVMAFYPMRLGSHFQTSFERMEICGSWTVIYLSPIDRMKQELSELWSATKKEENGGDLTLALFQGAVRRPSKENQFFFFKTLMHLHLKLRKCKWWKKIVT